MNQTITTDYGLPVEFTFEYHRENLAEFQNTGRHFVPAVRRRDARGQLTMQPRDWEGEDVHTLTLLQDGEHAKTKNMQTGEPESFLRVVTDTQEEAERQACEAIQNYFWNAKRVQELQSFQAEQLRKSVDERTRLVNWMISNGHGRSCAEILGRDANEEIAELLRAAADPAIQAHVAKLTGDSSYIKPAVAAAEAPPAAPSKTPIADSLRIVDAVRRLFGRDRK